MTRTFQYGFLADEFVERLIDLGHYNTECHKVDGLWVVTW